MQVLVVIASETDVGGESILPSGDRAATHWGLALGSTMCQVRHPPGDAVAATYARAVGTAPELWSNEERLPSDLVLIGPGAIDHWGDELAGRLAERHSATLVFDVLSADRDGADWRVVCDAGRGAQDVLRIAGRLVAVLSAHVPRPAYVSSYRRRKAARHANTGSVAGPQFVPWRAVEPRRRRAVVAPCAGADDRANAMFGITTSGHGAQGRQTIAGTPKNCAEVLLRYLVHHGFVVRNVPARAPSVHVPVDHSPPAPLTTAAAPSLAPALLRSPRRPGESGLRRTRKARLVADTLPVVRQANSAALQRRPRRVPGDTAVATRGPFRLINICSPTPT